MTTPSTPAADAFWLERAANNIADLYSHIPGLANAPGLQINIGPLKKAPRSKDAPPYQVLRNSEEHEGNILVINIDITDTTQALEALVEGALISEGGYSAVEAMNIAKTVAKDQHAFILEELGEYPHSAPEHTEKAKGHALASIKCPDCGWGPARVTTRHIRKGLPMCGADVHGPIGGPRLVISQEATRKPKEVQS